MHSEPQFFDVVDNIPTEISFVANLYHKWSLPN